MILNFKFITVTKRNAQYKIYHQIVLHEHETFLTILDFFMDYTRLDYLLG